VLNSRDSAALYICALSRS